MSVTEKASGVYALYTAPDAVQRAVDGLRGTGIAERNIVVMSAEPFEEYEFGQRDARTSMPWIAALGGAIGLSAATAMLVMLPTSWPIVTSAMPIVSWWPNLIIMFEMTMLSAIIATVITLLITAGLPSRGEKLYDPAVSEGYILVGVENPPDSARLESALALDGARVKKI